MEKVFVIGDIHGGVRLLEKILQFWNEQEEQLVFLGDYVDRGPDSLKVVQKVMELTENSGAIALCGNHEQLFLKWLQYPEKLKDYYLNPKIGGINTVESFSCATIDYENISELAQFIKSKYYKEIEYIKNLDCYYHWNQYLFVHAGINPKVDNFKDSKEEDFMWIRDEFYNVPHQSKEIVVFGHTPTMVLNEDHTSKLWISPCRKKVGIDGGGAIATNGRLHGVVFSKNSNEITVHAVHYDQQFESYTIQI